jgi:iron complex outermembrane receptor protein
MMDESIPTSFRRRARRPSLSLALVGAVALAGTAPSVINAQQERDSPSAERSYDISGGPLNEVLNRFAATAGISLAGAGELTANQTTPGLEGRFTTEEALDRLLADTGVGYRFTDAETVTLVDDPQGNDRLEPIRVEAAAGGADDAYSDPVATTASKRPVPKIETPAAVTTVPREVIDDQQAEGLEEALRNVSGTVFADGGEGVNISSRGLSATTYQDGFLLTGFTGGDVNRSQLDTYNIERIEVLKGPASVLYGRANPGGIVNLITRKPEREAAYEAGMRVDDEGGWRPTLDLTGPISDDGSVRYRLNAMYEDGESHREKVESEDYAVAPSLAWDITDDTSLLIQTEFIDFEETPDGGVPGRDGELVSGISSDAFFGEPDDERTIERETLKVTLDHDFGQGWSWKNAVRLESDDTLSEFARPDGIAADGRTATRSFITSGSETEDYRWRSELTGTLQTGGIEHDLLLGFELGRRESEVLFSGAPIDGIDIFNPSFGAEPGNPNFTFVSNSERDLAGVFAQDRLALSDAWTLVLGGRYDYVDQTIVSGLVGNTSEQPAKEDQKFSPNAGVVYRPTEQYSVYFNWSRSFQPVNGALSDAQGDILEPETGELFEVGTKAELADGRLTGTAAVFRIDRENVAESVPGQPFQENQGEVRSEGFELDVKGELLPGWEIVGAYAYTDATIEDNPDSTRIGNEVSEIPEHSGRLWSTYQFQGGDLDGLGFSGGVTYVGSRPRTDANEDELASYETVDAGIFYEQPRFTARLNVRNVLDEEDNILGRKRGTFLRVGPPRQARASVSVRF